MFKHILIALRFSLIRTLGHRQDNARDKGLVRRFSCPLSGELDLRSGSHPVGLLLQPPPSVVAFRRVKRTVSPTSDVSNNLAEQMKFQSEGVFTEKYEKVWDPIRNGADLNSTVLFD